MKLYLATVFEETFMGPVYVEERAFSVKEKAFDYVKETLKPYANSKTFEPFCEIKEINSEVGSVRKIFGQYDSECYIGDVKLEKFHSFCKSLEGKTVEEIVNEVDKTIYNYELTDINDFVGVAVNCEYGEYTYECEPFDEETTDENMMPKKTITCDFEEY